MNNQISKVDLINLEFIRNGVKELIQKSSKHDDYNIKVLDIAPQVHNGAKEFFIKSQLFTLDIDKNSGADYIVDLCENNSSIIPSDHFDLIICTEVLEHTLNPFDAVNEIYRILKPSGLAYVSTPFNLRIHGPLPDCWRFTEHGLRSLFRSFSNIEITEVVDNDRFLMPIQYHTIAKK